MLYELAMDAPALLDSLQKAPQSLARSLDNASEEYVRQREGDQGDDMLQPASSRGQMSDGNSTHQRIGRQSARRRPAINAEAESQRLKVVAVSSCSAMVL